jgi:RHS repeat-associated protein
MLVSVVTGAVAQRVRFDACGVPTYELGTAETQPVGFVGSVTDADTGLVHFGARDYDPALGQWVSKDPIRFEGGINLHGYVHNDPLNRIDPSGSRSSGEHRLMCAIVGHAFGAACVVACAALAPSTAFGVRTAKGLKGVCMRNLADLREEAARRLERKSRTTAVAALGMVVTEPVTMTMTTDQTSRRLNRTSATINLVGISLYPAPIPDRPFVSRRRWDRRFVRDARSVATQVKHRLPAAEGANSSAHSHRIASGG